MKETRYLPGREFGCTNPRVIYVALRWNGRPNRSSEEKMLDGIAKKLKQQKVQEADMQKLRIYNLLPPKKDMGMAFSFKDLDDVEKTIGRIKSVIDECRSVKLIVVGGRSDPMPQVALLLKYVVPKIAIDLRNHHKARGLMKPLAMVRKIR